MSKRLLTLSAIVLGLAFQAGNVSGSAFRVTPIRVDLERSGSSALLTLVNESKETLRFQISANQWAQDPAGVMKLEPTQEILFFPAMVTLAAGEERKVRVSAKTAAGAVEKSYRIFFEELPPLVTADTAAQGAQVRILTKMGVPIFLAPQRVVEKAAVSNARFEAGTLRFDVRNEGTIRFAVQAVKLRGLDAAGSTLFEKTLDGWYVLAGTERSYSFEIPADVCSKLKAVVLTAQTDSAAPDAASASARVDVSGPVCK